MLALAEERSFAAITVRDITRRADVNRATFYLHYRDKDDLVAQVLDALFDEVTAEDRAFTEAHGRLTAEIVPPPLVALFRHIAERPRLYHSLLSGDGSSVFAAQLRAFHETQFLQFWHEMDRPTAAGGPPPALQARYAAAAVQGVISWWLDNGRRESPETMAAWLWALLLPLWFTPPDAHAP